MNERDAGRMRDMLEEGQRLQHALAGQTRQILDNYLIANGVCFAIALIGEAASQVSETTRQQYPSIRWKEVTGMRNFLIHQYHRVDMDIVWKTATESVPELVEQITSILFTDDDNE